VLVLFCFLGPFTADVAEDEGEEDDEDEDDDDDDDDENDDTDVFSVPETSFRFIVVAVVIVICGGVAMQSIRQIHLLV
jgi:hypothetical protein